MSRSPSEPRAPLESCPHCGAGLDSALVCESCEALLELPGGTSPYAVLGLPLSYTIDRSNLKKRLLALSRRVHPDFFGAAGDTVRARAERNSAELNAAHRLLADEISRADWLVTHLDGPREHEERSMPLEFLQEVLEWNEAIEEARASSTGSPQRAALEPLALRLDAERADLLADIARRLTPLPPPRSPDLVEVRKHINAIRYLDRSRSDIADLSLERASNPA